MMNDQLSERLALIDKVAPDEINQDVTFEGATFEVAAGVFNPAKGKSSRRMMSALRLIPPSEDTRIADVGTGSGVIPILLWLRGCRNIVACDLLPNAISNAQRNFDRLGFRIPVTHSDLLENLQGDFDYIIFNAPATHPTRVNSPVGSVTLWDPEGNLKGRFVNEVRARYPSKRIKVFFMYSRYVDYDPLESIDFYGFDVSHLLVEKDAISESGVILLTRN